MKLRYSHILAAGLCLLLTSTTLYAQPISQTDVPKTFSYQGLLTATDGSPLPDGLHTITVTLYGDQAGTQVIWRDSYEALTTGGLFNLYLGSGEQALPKGQQLNRPLWVGTSVDGGVEMGPLTPLSSSPYALNVSDGAITGEKLAAGAVTADKVDMDYVSGISIDGKPVTAKGTVLELRSSDGISLDYSDETQTLTIGTATSQKRASEGKGPQTLSTPDAWNSQGDLTDGSAQVTTVSGDWIGTTGNVNNGEYDFTIKVHDEQIMKYQHRTDANTPNIVGGHSANTIGSGMGNIIAGGGSSAGPHSIGDDANYNAISGGEWNAIGDDVNHSFIGGGHNNLITQDYSTIGGGGNPNTNKSRGSGDVNYIKSEYGFIGGGRGNWIEPNAHDATIGGGIGNTIEANSHPDGYIPNESGGTIGGGGGNVVKGYHATVAGGHHNQAIGHFSFVGGGGHDVHGPGGNQAIGVYSVIGGGKTNLNYGYASTLVGGEDNEIGTATIVANHSAVGGGKENVVYSIESVITGGRENRIDGYNGTIGGGRNNTIHSSITGNGGAVISGGREHNIYAFESAIVGGAFHTIMENAHSSFIGGGSGNRIETDANYGTIGGGATNVIFAAPPGYNPNPATLATIPGGDHLIAQSWAQTVIGGWNEAKGSVPFRFQGTHDKNEPIFIIGNGIGEDELRSNAFEVSYNGHSIVFDENGSGGWLGGGARGVVDGGTYTDNIVYGWAEIDVQGEVLNACGNFGIANVQRLGTGVYQVTLNVVGPDGISPATINCGAVTATLGSGQKPIDPLDPPIPPGEASIPTTIKCAQITTSNIQGNVFDVYISSLAAPGIECTEGIDMPFKFHVTGRVD